MTTDVYVRIADAIQTGLASAFPLYFSACRVCIPARSAEAGCYCPDPLSCEEAARILNALRPFPAVLGVPLVERVEGKNHWLRFRFTGAFFDALTWLYIRELPEPDSDLGEYALNRMMALSRQGGRGCPAYAPIQRAMLLTAGLVGGHSSLIRVRRALNGMTLDPPPGERAKLAAQCGDVGAAASRILHHHLSIQCLQKG